MKLCQYLQPNLCSNFPGGVFQLGISASLCVTLPGTGGLSRELWPSGVPQTDLGWVGEFRGDFGICCRIQEQRNPQVQGCGCSTKPRLSPRVRGASFPKPCFPKSRALLQPCPSSKNASLEEMELLIRERLLVIVLSEIKIFILFLAKKRGD